jgi:cytochrome o ubiquinol oxidase subunit 2
MRKKRAKQKKLIAGLLVLAILALAINFIASRHFAVLSPQGPIAKQQRDLLVFATILSLAVILPVFWLTFHIVHTYRVDAKKPGKYQPEWDGNRNLEGLWWTIPTIIIFVLSVVTWNTSHSLDPYRPLSSTQKPLTIQVIALQWKWLFLYPEQGIATVNFVQLPVDRPVTFDITADAPMNSFWIPQLGGQIYAMTGMSSQLHLQADKPGAYRGSSANLSGKGFANMDFTARATSQAEFDAWATTAKAANPNFGYDQYQILSLPDDNEPTATYSLADDQLYTTVMAKYMNHGAGR